MDCQVIMGAFASLYHANFIRNWSTVASVMDNIYDMPIESQIEILKQLSLLLESKGVIPV
jgi:hypothetical protein